jgi:hypothetical protein
MSIIEFIRDRARYYNCPVCGRSLRGCEVRMLSHVDDRFTVRVTCAACSVPFIVILAIQGPGIEAVAEDGIQLEEEREAPSAAAPEAGPEPEPIDPDEVLDVHLLLRDFHGPLTELLKQPDHSRG